MILGVYFLGTEASLYYDNFEWKFNNMRILLPLFGVIYCWKWPENVKDQSDIVSAKKP